MIHSRDQHWNTNNLFTKDRMALPSSDYRNPLQVAIRRQEEHIRKEAACGQCRERVSFHWHGEELVNCGRKYQQYGKRCEHFRKTAQAKEEDV